MKYKNAIILKLILISETIMNKIDLLFIFSKKGAGGTREENLIR